MLANAILRHRPFSLDTTIRWVLYIADEYVPVAEEALLQQYVATINIDMVSYGFRYVSRDEVPLLGLGALELFVESGNRSCSPGARCGTETRRWPSGDGIKRRKPN